LSLNGRLTRLEAAYAPPVGPDHCRQCGLRHVRPMTIGLIRRTLRVAGGSDAEMERPVPLCLCACCTSDPGDRWFARLSHGLPDEGNVACV
jgi:hypothetical protein